MDRMEQTVSIGENLIEYYAQIDDIYDMPVFFFPLGDLFVTMARQMAFFPKKK